MIVLLGDSARIDRDRVSLIGEAFGADGFDITLTMSAKQHPPLRSIM